jgi:hypothetical protein
VTHTLPSHQHRFRHVSLAHARTASRVWLACVRACVQVWRQLFTEDGLDYYVNTETNETTWDKPEELMTSEELNQSGDWLWAPHPTEVSVCRPSLRTRARTCTSKLHVCVCGLVDWCARASGSRYRIATVQLCQLRASNHCDPPPPTHTHTHLHTPRIPIARHLCPLERLAGAERRLRFR